MGWIEATNQNLTFGRILWPLKVETHAPSEAVSGPMVDPNVLAGLGKSNEDACVYKAPVLGDVSACVHGFSACSNCFKVVEAHFWTHPCVAS